MKDEVYAYYGDKCKCCGESTRAFLQLDHVNNDGAKLKREKVHPTGVYLYKWIIDNKYPLNIQLLCANCNWGKMMNNGICPHKN